LQSASNDVASLGHLSSRCFFSIAPKITPHLLQRVWFIGADLFRSARDGGDKTHRHRLHLRRERLRDRTGQRHGKIRLETLNVPVCFT